MPCKYFLYYSAYKIRTKTKFTHLVHKMYSEQFFKCFQFTKGGLHSGNLIAYDFQDNPVK